VRACPSALADRPEAMIAMLEDDSVVGVAATVVESVVAQVEDSNFGDALVLACEADIGQPVCVSEMFSSYVRVEKQVQKAGSDA
jgi:hypothetical protein